MLEIAMHRLPYTFKTFLMRYNRALCTRLYSVIKECWIFHSDNTISSHLSITLLCFFVLLQIKDLRRPNQKYLVFCLWGNLYYFINLENTLILLKWLNCKVNCQAVKVVSFLPSIFYGVLRNSIPYQSVLCI